MFDRRGRTGTGGVSCCPRLFYGYFSGNRRPKNLSFIYAMHLFIVGLK
jgi:hypothetical protein